MVAILRQSVSALVAAAALAACSQSTEAECASIVATALERGLAGDLSHPLPTESLPTARAPLRVGLAQNVLSWSHGAWRLNGSEVSIEELHGQVLVLDPWDTSTIEVAVPSSLPAAELMRALDHLATTRGRRVEILVQAVPEWSSANALLFVSLDEYPSGRAAATRSAIDACGTPPSNLASLSNALDGTSVGAVPVILRAAVFPEPQWIAELQTVQQFVDHVEREPVVYTLRPPEPPRTVPVE